MTFHATTIATGTVTYSVYGETVTKEVMRETMVYENISGVYDIVGSTTQTCIGPAPSGTFVRLATMNISQSGNTVVGIEAGCAMTGTYTQTRKLGKVDGNFSCASGESGIFNLHEIVVTESGFIGHVLQQSSLCSSISGSYAGNRR